MQIRFHCPHCDLPMRISRWETFNDFHCPKCHQFVEHQVKDSSSELQDLDHCLICGNPNLFRQKLFNRNWGIAIVVIGVIISLFIRMKVIPLLIVAFIDLMLYLFLPFMAVCYSCDAEYRGFKSIKSLKFYDHLKAARVKNEPTYPGAEENH